VPLDGFADWRASPPPAARAATSPCLQAGGRPGGHPAERARALAGAANTWPGGDGSWYADNTDGLGLVADITRNAGVALAGAMCCCWARAAPRPACWARCWSSAPPHRGLQPHAAKARRWSPSMRNWQHARTWCCRHAQQALDGDFDVIINATASSLQGAGVPVPASGAAPAAWPTT
jgi:shikimate dehydrogenase